MSETFQLVVMGCTGGPWEANLSGYLLSPLAHPEWVALDAGTLLAGIDRAVEKNQFDQNMFTDSELLPSADFLLHHLKALLISHAHLDHIAGLIINSQIDTSKAILGIAPTIDNIRDHVFNGRIWPNYGDEGVEPLLGKYHYVRLPLHTPTPIPDTTMHVEPYLLSHPHGYPSTAFLIDYKGDYVLYFGDTSSDFLEVEKHLARIWKRIAPLIQEGKLKGMLLECSYAHGDSKNTVFGHLDTKLLMRELHHLAEIAEASLEGLKLIVTHRKKNINKGEEPLQVIADELTSINDLGIHFLFPTQGDKFLL